MGGYYDAGDHVKFGLPMAFSVTMLSWAAVDFKDDFTKSNQMGHILEAIKWGTDYFIKCHPQPNVLWGQVHESRIKINSTIKLVWSTNFMCDILRSCIVNVIGTTNKCLIF